MAINPYPNRTMLEIVEGERAGVPVLPPAKWEPPQTELEKAIDRWLKGLPIPGGRAVKVPTEQADPAIGAAKKAAEKVLGEGGWQEFARVFFTNAAIVAVILLAVWGLLSGGKR